MENAQLVNVKLEALFGPKVGLEHQVLTVTSTVNNLTIPENSTRCLIVVESSATGFAIRYWEDGSDPTTTDGLPWSNGDRFEIVGMENMGKFRVIQAQAGTHKLQIQYFR